MSKLNHVERWTEDRDLSTLPSRCGLCEIIICLGRCYWLVSGTWILLCDACRRPESPLKNYKENEKVTWLVKKKSCVLGLQPEVAFTMNETRRCRPGIWNKVAVACYCSCFQNHMQVWDKFCRCTQKICTMVPWCDSLRIPDCTAGLMTVFLASSSSGAICGLCWARSPSQHKRWSSHRREHLKSLNYVVVLCVVLWLRVYECKLNKTYSIGLWRWCVTFELIDFLDFFPSRVLKYEYNTLSFGDGLFWKKQTWRGGLILFSKRSVLYCNTHDCRHQTVWVHINTTFH